MAIDRQRTYTAPTARAASARSHAVPVGTGHRNCAPADASAPRQSQTHDMRDVQPAAGERPTSSGPEYTRALLRHFADLRDGTHGGARSRADKERLFVDAVALLDPYARRALDEMNTSLMLDTGEVVATEVRRSAGGGSDAVWSLSWPEQRAAGIKPVLIRAYFGLGFLHPHLRSGTVGDWPLNVFDDEQAAAELPTLRALAAADIHNLVLQLGGDYRLIPAVVSR
jgi:hypothetical protein